MGANSSLNKLEDQVPIHLFFNQPLINLPDEKVENEIIVLILKHENCFTSYICLFAFIFLLIFLMYPLLVGRGWGQRGG